MSNFGFKLDPTLPMFPVCRKRGFARPFSLAQKFENKVFECFDVARQQFPEHRDQLLDLDRIPVVFFEKGRTAGWARYRPYLNLEFNAYLVRTEWDEMVNSTIPHEVAHIVDYLIHGRSDQHGPKWQRIAIALGDVNVGKRTHSMKTQRARKTKRHQYIAKCGTELWLSTQMHNKVMRGSIRRVNTTKGLIDHSCCTGKVKMVG